jgi:hypothetical protein
VFFTCTTAFPVIATPFVSAHGGYFAIVLYKLAYLEPRPFRGRRIATFNSILFLRDYSCRRIEEPSPSLCPVVLSCALFRTISSRLETMFGVSAAACPIRYPCRRSMRFSNNAIPQKRPKGFGVCDYGTTRDSDIAPYLGTVST